MGTFTYIVGLGFVTSDIEPEGWTSRWPVTALEAQQIADGAALSVVDGQLVIVPAPPFVPVPPVVPYSVRSAQLRQWLVDAGLYDVIQSMFSNPAAWPDEPTRQKANIRREFEVNVVRADPLLVALASGLGLTSEQLDAAFIAAQAIE